MLGSVPPWSMFIYDTKYYQNSNVLFVLYPTPDKIFFTSFMIQMVSYISAFYSYFYSLLATKCSTSVHCPQITIYILLILYWTLSLWSMERLISCSWIFTRAIIILSYLLSSVCMLSFRKSGSGFYVFDSTLITSCVLSRFFIP